jgi:DNA repair protein RadC
MRVSACSIRDMPGHERPREKMFRYGPDVLTDAELLCMVFRTGTRDRDVFALAAQVLSRIGMGGLSTACPQDFRKIPGIGPAKACALGACIELGRRLFLGKKTQLRRILSPRDVFDELKDIRESRKEHFVAFFLDSRNQQICREIISVGTVNASLVHPREVFEPAVRHTAVQIIVAHNHPSGDKEPSEEDLDVNKRLVAAGRLLGIEIIDHVIVTGREYLSFKSRGLLT